MPEYVRVNWKATGHESTIPAHRFDPERHTKTDKAAVDESGDVLPPKYRTTVAKSAAAKKKAQPAVADPEHGHQADTDKENN